MPIAKLRTMGVAIRTFDARAVKVAPKVAAPIYRCRSYREWREIIISRAGGRCEAIVDGQRCAKARPGHRMYADHIEEIRDGGDRFDLQNGRCLCGSHHTAKTYRARAQRRFAQ